MGNQVSLVPKVSYEDIQMVVYRNTHIPHSTLIINTLPRPSSTVSSRPPWIYDTKSKS